MPKLTHDEFDEFLATYKIVRVSTLNEDGSPYGVPALFDYKDSAMLIAARGRSAWYANIKHDPRVSLCIDEIDGKFRRVIVSHAKAEILYEPGREKEWWDIKRMIESNIRTDESTDQYLLNVSKIPYALLSIRFEYDAENVSTWQSTYSETDQSGLMAKKYGEIVNTRVDPEKFLENPNL